MACRISGALCARPGSESNETSSSTESLRGFDRQTDLHLTGRGSALGLPEQVITIQRRIKSMDWVSFDEIKKTVSLQMAIDHYGIRLRQRVNANTLRGKCPLPTHGSKNKHREFHGHTHQRRGRGLGVPVAIVHQSPWPRRRQRARFRRRDGTTVPSATRRSNCKRGFWFRPRATTTTGWQGTSRGKFRGQGTEGRTCFKRKH